MPAPHRESEGSSLAERYRSLQGAYWRNRYAILFASLLMTLGLTPMLSALEFPREVLIAFLGLNLCAAVVGADGARKYPAVNLILAGALTLRLVAVAVGASSVVMGTQVVWTGVAFVAAARAVRFALQSRHIDRQHVFAALSAYLIAGHFFGMLYATMDRIWPGSFTIAGVASDPLELADAIYFSFVTMTTLGYGDIVPVASGVRGIVVVEAVVGQLYLAVLVARLVGLHSHDLKSSDGN